MRTTYDNVYFNSSEVFQIVCDPIERSKVKIFGYHVDSDDVSHMILSVREDVDGKPEAPKFRTKEETESVGCEAGMLIKNLVHCTT